MKKLLLTAAIAVFGFTSVNAQDDTPSYGFEEGDVILEGNLGFNSSKDDFGDGFEDKSSRFTFNPKAGYFISDDFAVGLELNVLSQKQEDITPGNTDETKVSTFGLGAFARYYFLDLGERFKTYGEFGVGYASLKQEFNGTDTLEGNSIGAGVGLGMNYFITENFAINFALTDILAFSSSKTEVPNVDDSEVKTNNISGNLNVFNNFFDTAQFGVTWKF